jgi:hypothetical protein
MINKYQRAVMEGMMYGIGLVKLGSVSYNILTEMIYEQWTFQVLKCKMAAMIGSINLPTESANDVITSENIL